MKDQRHKRKETFSVLMISNTDRHSRQFQISLFSLRLVFSILLVVLVVLGLLVYQFFAGNKKQSSLQEQLASQKEQTQQLEEEVQELRRSASKAEENVQMQKVETVATTEPTAEPDKDSTFPSIYPTHGSSVLKTGFTVEQPYISINTYAGGSVVATAQGTVVSVSSDDTYRHIIEIQHESGYTTRYMCQQEGEVAVAQGALVQPEDVLINITTDSTQLDYQVIYEGAPMDPLMLIDAKG